MGFRYDVAARNLFLATLKPTGIMDQLAAWQVRLSVCMCVCMCFRGTFRYTLSPLLALCVCVSLCLRVCMCCYAEVDVYAYISLGLRVARLCGHIFVSVCVCVLMCVFVVTVCVCVCISRC